MGGSTLEARIFEPRLYLGWLLFTLSAGFAERQDGRGMQELRHAPSPAT